MEDLTEKQRESLRKLVKNVLAKLGENRENYSLSILESDISKFFEEGDIGIYGKVKNFLKDEGTGLKLTIARRKDKDNKREFIFKDDDGDIVEFILEEGLQNIFEEIGGLNGEISTLNERIHDYIQDIQENGLFVKLGGNWAETVIYSIDQIKESIDNFSVDTPDTTEIENHLNDATNELADIYNVLERIESTLSYNLDGLAIDEKDIHKMDEKENPDSILQQQQQGRMLRKHKMDKTINEENIINGETPEDVIKRIEDEEQKKEDEEDDKK